MGQLVINILINKIHFRWEYNIFIVLNVYLLLITRVNFHSLSNVVKMFNIEKGLCCVPRAVYKFIINKSNYLIYLYSINHVSAIEFNRIMHIKMDHWSIKNIVKLQTIWPRYYENIFFFRKVFLREHIFRNYANAKM